MIKTIHIAIVLALLVALIPATTTAHTVDDPFITDLIAGGGNVASAINVGEVLVWNDGENLYVKYVTVDGWCLSETHLQVATSLGGIPQKNGNPIPGQFVYIDEFDICEDEFVYKIPLTWSAGTPLQIAAHAVVRNAVGFEDPNLENFAAALPDQVIMSVQYAYFGAPAYFPVTTVSGGTVLDGTYEGWCIDTDRVIAQDTPYTANVFSSYETLPVGLLEYPENLDLVNWIINEDFVGQTSPTGYGIYTYGDVQRAIWTLIDDGQYQIANWSQNRVDEILAAAYASGEGFTPGCDDYVAVILQPVYGQQIITIAQVTFASVGIPCTPIFQYDTAWGAGSAFPGKNWATYFPYTVQ